MAGFHHRVARQIANKMPCKLGDEWIYPPLGEAMEEAGLRPIRHYIAKRQAHMAAFLATRPIYELCLDAMPRCGSSRCTRYWTQCVLDEEDDDGTSDKYAPNSDDSDNDDDDDLADDEYDEDDDDTISPGNSSGSRSNSSSSSSSSSPIAAAHISSNSSDSNSDSSLFS